MDNETDAQRRQRLWQRARRDIARRHHPDVGGDPQVYVDLMTGLDRQFGEEVDPRPSHASLARRVRRRAARTRRRLRRHVRAVRGRLPQRFPGARRYIDL